MEEVTERSAFSPHDVSALLAEIARLPPRPAGRGGPALAPGATVAGRFRLVRELGRGGFGAAWEALDERLQRPVALKVLDGGGRGAGERGEEEAQAVARLAHANIVQIHDAGWDGRDAYLVLELLRGETLEARLARTHVSPERAVEIAIAIARALAHAHAAGVLHRDLKPSNVFLTEDGGVKVLDFGLAHLLGRPAPPEGGTPGFMSPEQRRGTPEDERSDVYALGELLRRMLAGAASSGASPSAAPRVAPELGALVRRMLAEDRRDRPRDGAAALAELLAARDASAARSRAEGGSRLRARAGSLVLGLLALVAAGLGSHGIDRDASAAVGGERLTLVVADVANATGDRDLDALSGLLITSLEQSRRLAVITRSRMLDLARQLGHAHVERVDETVGRQIARAAGARALVLATVQRFDDVYALQLVGVEPGGDTHLFSVKASARGRAAVPALVDAVSQDARRALRERESDLATARTPVAESLTPSLEAYRHYFEAKQLDDSQFEAERALAAYRRALKADPAFALPHLEIAIMAGWHEAPEEDPAWHLAEAARHAQRLPEKERKLVLAWKARQEGRFPEARVILEGLASAHPDDKEVLYLAGETLWHGGTPDGFAEGARYFRRALDLDPAYLVAMVHLLQWIAVLGEPEEALVRARRAAAVAPGPMTLAMLARAHAYAGDADAALAGAGRAVELAGGGHFESSYVLAEVRFWAGRHAEAEAELQRWIDPSASPGQQRVALEFLPILLAAEGRRREALRAFDGLTGTGCAKRCDTFDETLKLHLLLAGGDRRAAREELARWEPPDDLEVQPHLWLWPWLGLAEEGSRRAAGLVAGSLWERRYAGAAALARGDPAAAVEILSALARRDPAVETHFLLAEALLGAGRPRDALVPLATATDTFPLYAPRWQAAFRPWALLLRARTHARLGELGPARAQLARLRTEWRRADRELPLGSEIRSLARELGR